jgi:hypothetical protein
MFTVPKEAVPFHNAYLILVTPQMASMWLANNNYNRDFDSKEVEKYVCLILEEKWRRTHQGLAFDQDGLLIDGQHRLMAIVKSEKSVPMLMFVNEPPENHEAIDCGKKRTHLDSVKLELRDSRITTKHISTLRAMLAGRLCMKKNWSNTEINTLYSEYSPAIEFVLNAFSGVKSKEIDDVTVRGVIARAFYRVPTERLAEFCNLLCGGQPDHPQAEIMMKLRYYLFGVENQRESTRREIYKRTEYTLQAFLRNETSVAFPLYPSELYPLPGEKEVACA